MTEPITLLSPPPSIMIVDDNPANLKLLEEMLQRKGHEVRSFPLARLALAAAMKTPPDLILLDINMPEMNGYETCERLKSIPDLAGVPVIFLSALNDVQDKVTAFRSGGVDYISKPFQFEEVHARVETHLSLHNLQRALKEHNHQLEGMVAARTRALAQANDRLSILDSAKTEFLQLISHELRTPLNGLLVAGELILDDMPSTAENAELRKVFERSRGRVMSVIDDALLLTQIDVNGTTFSSGPVSLPTVLAQAVHRVAEFAQSRQVKVFTRCPGSERIRGNEFLLTRAFQSLLETAVKFSDPGAEVQVMSGVISESPSVTISSRGKTIPSHLIPKFFDVFAIAESATSGGDLGLSQAVAHRIFSLFGASVNVSNCDPAGIKFAVSWRTFTLA